jgi:hypothetical protein
MAHLMLRREVCLLRSMMARFDTISYEIQPVILSQIPSLENGDAQIVRSGSAGWKSGGCRGWERGHIGRRGCAFALPNVAVMIALSHTTVLDRIEMDQMVVTFRMQP